MLLCHPNFLVAASVGTQRKNFSFLKLPHTTPRPPYVSTHRRFLSSPHTHTHTHRKRADFVLNLKDVKRRKHAGQTAGVDLAHGPELYLRS
jgi:hypothetical protein